jgi:type IV pilus assembly protein PilA
MLARIRKAQEGKESGFTLIELLVVMIIIGILAAIAIPAFLNQKKKARETSAKSDVSTIGKEVAAFYVDGTGALTLTTDAVGGTWTLTDAAAAEVATGELSDGNTATGGATSDLVYCVQVVNDTPDTSAWRYDQTGLVKGVC